MRLNKDIGGTGRQPRAIVKIGPSSSAMVPVDGWLNCEVVNNNQTSADTFHVTFATSRLPSAYNAYWFSTQMDMYVEIFFGFPEDANNYSSSDLKQYIFGQIDHIEFDPVNFLIELSGRDLTRVFIDTKSTQKYPNLTSSQIATKLAKAHGLTPNVTTTKGAVGKYYEIDHVTMTDEKSDWDLLIYLAGIEGYIVYVRNQTLYFGPRQAATGDEYVIEWRPPTHEQNTPIANVQTLNFTRALTVTRGIQVVIRSWNQKQAKGFTAYWPSQAKSIQVGKSTPFGGGQVYSRTIPNLTQDQATQKARALYDQIVAHEMRLIAELPGDTILDTTSVIQVTGTRTAFDQIYYPDTISRRMDWDGGLSMTVAAKNAAPESQALL